jgi:hypothetical protein
MSNLSDVKLVVLGSWVDGIPPDGLMIISDLAWISRTHGNGTKKNEEGKSIDGRTHGNGTKKNEEGKSIDGRKKKHDTLSDMKLPEPQRFKIDGGKKHVTMTIMPFNCNMKVG